MSLYEQLERFEGPRIVTVGLVSKGEILTGKRRDNGLWTSPGGHMDAGESVMEAAIREVKEESGIDITSDQLQIIDARMVESHRAKGKKFAVFAFLANVEREKASAKDDPDKEIETWKWVPIHPDTEELKKEMRHAKDDFVLSHLFKQEEDARRALGRMNGWTTGDGTESNGRGRPMKEVSASILKATGTVAIPSPTDNFDPKAR